MKVVITGANGFLGSWVTRRLINEGHEVHLVLRKNSDLKLIQELNYQTHIGDVTDKSSLLSAFSDADTIFHLAGVVAYTSQENDLMQKVNVLGTQNVVEAAVTAKVPNLVHLSSVTAIGASFDGIPLNEKSEYNIGHLGLGYFDTKRAGELIVKKAAIENSLRAVMLNPSTIYGPGDATKGSRKTQLKVARGSFPFYTSGGVNVVSVEDVVEGVLRAWKSGKNGERYILAGENITIKDLFERIAKTTGVKPPSIGLPNLALTTLGKIGDLLERIDKKGPVNSVNAWTARLFHWFENDKAIKELGLQFKSADYAISQSLDWVKENGLLKKS